MSSGSGSESEYDRVAREFFAIANPIEKHQLLSRSLQELAADLFDAEQNSRPLRLARPATIDGFKDTFVLGNALPQHLHTLKGIRAALCVYPNHMTNSLVPIYHGLLESVNSLLDDVEEAMGIDHHGHQAIVMAVDCVTMQRHMRGSARDLETLAEAQSHLDNHISFLRRANMAAFAQAVLDYADVCQEEEEEQYGEELMFNLETERETVCYH